MPTYCAMLLHGPSDPSAALMSSEATRIRQQELTSLRTELDIERERSLHRQRLLEEGEDERRRMHNIIQELRGSVRVFVRARPFLKSDGEDAAEQVGEERVFASWCHGDIPGLDTWHSSMYRQYYGGP